MKKYIIARINNKTSEVTFLSQKKRRWLDVHSERRRCIFTEQEADAFIKNQQEIVEVRLDNYKYKYRFTKMIGIK